MFYIFSGYFCIYFIVRRLKIINGGKFSIGKEVWKGWVYECLWYRFVESDCWRRDFVFRDKIRCCESVLDW